MLAISSKGSHGARCEVSGRKSAAVNFAHICKCVHNKLLAAEPRACHLSERGMSPNCSTRENDECFEGFFLPLTWGDASR